MINETNTEKSPSLSVQSLVWEFHGVIRDRGSKWTASTIVGVYMVYERVGATVWFLPGSSSGIVEAENAELAKIAAQAHYRARILSVVNPPSVPPLSPVVQELQSILQRYVEDCDEARLWNGPTMYPKHPLADEKQTREWAKKLATHLETVDAGRSAIA